ncbi:MAG: TMEM143 family protein [Pseudomonadota bacterium]
MTPTEPVQRFIPYRKTDIVEMCCTEGAFSEVQVSQFRDVCTMLSSIFHFRFHHSLETLKNCYAPMNPDADTKFVYAVTEHEKVHREETLIQELKNLLDRANFESIEKEDLRQALSEESLFQIRLHVDFDDFEKFLFFRRGATVREETLVKWFGLIKKPITFLNYDRVVIYVKFKEQRYFDEKDETDLLFTPGSTIVKLFQNIPRSDLEMLFPNSEVRMKTIDKLMIGVPAAIGGIIMLATKLGATLVLVGALIAFWIGIRNEPVVLDQTALLALVAGAGTLGAYLWKQFSNFKNRKIRFMKTLADNLYFKNLDNNTGVFHRLVDAAEEEEFKETVLAYYFLLRENTPQTRETLDRNIQNWFLKEHGHSLDFEVGDAIAKLDDLGLLISDENGLSVVSLENAKQILHKRWDDFF